MTTLQKALARLLRVGLCKHASAHQCSPTHDSTSNGRIEVSQFWWHFTAPFLQPRSGILRRIPDLRAEGSLHGAPFSTWQWAAAAVCACLREETITHQNATTVSTLVFVCALMMITLKNNSTSSNMIFQSFRKCIGHANLAILLKLSPRGVNFSIYPRSNRYCVFCFTWKSMCGILALYF